MKTITRRGVAMGAAWAVPTILVGAAAPLAAASGPATIARGTGCKEPGASVDKDYPWGYNLVVSEAGASEWILLSVLDNDFEPVLGGAVGTATATGGSWRVFSSNSDSKGFTCIFQTKDGNREVVFGKFLPCKD